MVTYDVTLEVETAYEMHSGEVGLAYQYFVRGGHFEQAFINALIRVLAVEAGRRLVGPEQQIRPLVHHSWWREVPVTDPDDEEMAAFEFQACSEDVSEAFPVTWVYIGDLEDSHLFVDQCRACREDDHDRCSRLVIPPDVFLYHNVRGKSWVHDPGHLF